jgi:hypothetical protein
MNRRAPFVVVITSVFVSTASLSAGAQDEPRVAIGAAVIYSTQSTSALDNQVSPGFPKPGVGGSAAGLVVGTEVGATPTFGVGFELSYPARFEATQHAGGAGPAFRSVDQHRDVILSGLFHFHQQRTGLAWFDGVAGVSYVKEDTITQEYIAPPGSIGPFTMNGPETSVTRNALGVTVGFDVGLQIGPHFSLVPTLRSHIVNRANAGDSGAGRSSTLGLANTVWRLGVGARVAF